MGAAEIAKYVQHLSPFSAMYITYTKLATILLLKKKLHLNSKMSK